ncbi:MAG: hypothetical protein K0S14_3122 [Thermomicrobiales bacterium]|jgi:hypothetical protein|nr:hypothetical protein [Thermomicrobiales bacterium]
MGWASGSYLAQELWDDIRKHIPKAKRAKVAEEIITAFENNDADDWDEGSQLWSDSERPLTWPEEDEE